MIDKSVVAKLVVVNSSRVKDGDLASAEHWGVPRVHHVLLIVLFVYCLLSYLGRKRKLMRGLNHTF